MTIAVLALAPLAGCDFEPVALDPDPVEPPTHFDDPEEYSYVHPWVEDAAVDAGVNHNEALAFVVSELQEAATTNGMLTESQVMEIGKSATADYLLSNGMPAPSEQEWDNVLEQTESYFAGEDIVAGTIGSELSDEGESLAYEVLQSGTSSPADLEAAMEEVRQAADQSLEGNELEAFATITGVGYYSGMYWDSNVAEWAGIDVVDGTYSIGAGGCTWNDLLKSDIVGGLFGITFGAPVRGAIIASVGRGLLCILDGTIW